MGFECVRMPRFLVEKIAVGLITGLSRGWGESGMVSWSIEAGV